MKNPITEMFENIPDDELLTAVKEIESVPKTGIISTDGVVRKYAHLIHDKYKGNMPMDLLMSEIGIIREAAYRWADLK